MYKANSIPDKNAMKQNTETLKKSPSIIEDKKEDQKAKVVKREIGRAHV